MLPDPKCHCPSQAGGVTVWVEQKSKGRGAQLPPTRSAPEFSPLLLSCAYSRTLNASDREGASSSLPPSSRGESRPWQRFTRPTCLPAPRQAARNPPRPALPAPGKVKKLQAPAGRAAPGLHSLHVPTVGSPGDGPPAPGIQSGVKPPLTTSPSSPYSSQHAKRRGDRAGSPGCPRARGARRGAAAIPAPVRAPSLPRGLRACWGHCSLPWARGVPGPR